LGNKFLAKLHRFLVGEREWCNLQLFQDKWVGIVLKFKLEGKKKKE